MSDATQTVQAPAVEKIALDGIKRLGIVGAVIGFVGLLIDEFVVDWPPIGLILWFAGIVVTYVAVSRFSKAVNNIRIKQRYEWSILFSIFVLLFTILGRLTIGGALEKLFTALSYGELEEAAEALQTIILSFIATYIFWILSAKALKDSYDLVKKHTNIGMFRAVGLVYLIGAILFIAVGIGIYIVIIALLLHIIAWNQLPQHITIEKTVQA
ncbi:hypothetical protein Igag_1255 [Ignisphaera aggregans DSM 17230]|uniref:DUF996 domain-containing protein n=1 Tax=Ignisphaera aggregans (strain DSM 17230 / JCM 13409 / AQ1.S1) TaxID=583356 RepID=E0SPK5_IGNAA|nr:hypothetical protein Igag_1255 [Ignisphaera aggregans DSM 17230]